MELPVKTLYKLETQLKLFPQSDFGAFRKHDIHTGIDLYVAPDTEVRSLLDGVVYQTGIFTGPEADSHWWNYTEYVVIKSDGVYILYGELLCSVGTGQLISKGDNIGTITPALKEHKNKNPRHMLHLEVYYQYSHPVTWGHRDLRPKGLMNPRFILGV